MLAPLLGGTEITAINLDGRNRVVVTFRTELTGRVYQLYAGRRWIGVTPTVEHRSVAGVFLPSLWPEPLQLVAVDPADRFTHYGQQLSERPYNRHRVTCEAPADEDFDRIEICRADERDGDVNDDVVIAATKVVPGASTYSLDLPPITRRGHWAHNAWSADNLPAAGNRTEFAAFEIAAAVYPRDLNASSGRRFTVTSGESPGELQFAVSYPP